MSLETQRLRRALEKPLCPGTSALGAPWARGRGGRCIGVQRQGAVTEGRAPDSRASVQPGDRPTDVKAAERRRPPPAQPRGWGQGPAGREGWPDARGRDGM